MTNDKLNSKSILFTILWIWLKKKERIWLKKTMTNTENWNKKEWIRLKTKNKKRTKRINELHWRNKYQRWTKWITDKNLNNRWEINNEEITDRMNRGGNNLMWPMRDKTEEGCKWGHSWLQTETWRKTKILTKQFRLKKDANQAKILTK